MLGMITFVVQSGSLAKYWHVKCHWAAGASASWRLIWSSWNPALQKQLLNRFCQYLCSSGNLRKERNCF